MSNHFAHHLKDNTLPANISQKLKNMSKIIKIGTRDNEVAIYQAEIVQQQLEHLGHKCILVPVKSTENSDVAIINSNVDIAVHSFNDVPKNLPEGIIQVAVLKRGNIRDTLVYKQNEEFLGLKNAVIAIGNPRRRTQWLNRYPTHKVVSIEGDVRESLQKLEDNSEWDAAILAAADLGRLDLRPETSVNLNWMVPAPGQGTIMITAFEGDDDIKEICAELNHEETEICTNIEREFLSLLEGDITDPIGAIAFIKDEEIAFIGVLLSPDGSRKIEVTRNQKVGEHYDIASFCANYIIDRGGKRLIDSIKVGSKQTTIYSTKSLTETQRLLFHDKVIVGSSDFVKTNLNRIKPSVLKNEIKNVIITDKNAVESLITNYSAAELQFPTIYCVGRRTKKLIENRIGKVTHAEKNAEKLAEYLVDYIEGSEATYFCSNLKSDNIVSTLEESNIKVNLIEAYQTKYDALKMDETIEGVLFYSASTIQSYLLENKANEIAFCINETTATEAKKHFKDVRVSKIPTTESLIELVNENYA